MVNYTNAKGKKLSNNDLRLLNNGSNTYLHPGHGTYSTTDLRICEPELLLDFLWQTWDDLCGSGDFPFIITATK